VSEAVAYRIASWDTPLRVNPNRTAGRFNERGSPATQYLSLHPLGPWAEYLRAVDLRDPRELAERRLRIWALRVDLTGAQRIDFSNAVDFGLEHSEDLIADNHSACRALAERLRADPRAPRTLIVPSAALPGTDNVVIFGERVQIPYSWQPISAVDIPACVIAERSQPPAGASSLVRYRGDSHPAFEAWRAGRSYRFRDLSRP
jgi:RES domain-containing protein